MHKFIEEIKEFETKPFIVNNFFNKEFQSHYWKLNDMIHFLTYYEFIKKKYSNYNDNYNNNLSTSLLFKGKHDNYKYSDIYEELNNSVNILSGIETIFFCFF